MRRVSSTFTTIAGWAASPCVAIVALAGLPAVSAAQIAWGTYTGDASSPRTITDVGFAPVSVIVKLDGDEAAHVRTDTMPLGMSKSLADGPSPQSFILELTRDGFVVSDDREVNAGSETYHWLALARVPGHVATGSYAGDGTGLHTIGGLSFRPAFLLLLPESSREATHKSSAMPGSASIELGGASWESDRILDLTPAGFAVGSSDHVNKDGVTYHYVALSGTVSESGSYAGDGSPRFLPAVREPVLVIVKSAQGHTGLFRTESLRASTRSMPFGTTGFLSDGIVALSSSGAWVGSSSVVNTPGDQYFHSTGSMLSADLALDARVDDPSPRELDDVEYTVLVGSLGPDVSPDVEVASALPPGVSYRSHDTSRGPYAPASGIWSPGDVFPGEVDTLRILGTVQLGTAGQTLELQAEVDPSAVPDPDPTNDTTSVSVTVDGEPPEGADTWVMKIVDNLFPTEGDEIEFSITVGNGGPLGATAVVVTDSMPPGLTYVSQTSTLGAFDPATGEWQIGTLAAGATEKLTLFAGVDAGTGGSTLTNTARRSAQSQVDHVPENDADSVSVTVQPARTDRVSIEIFEIQPTTILPGSPPKRVVDLRLVNESASEQTLDEITFTNLTTGPGMPAELDASWTGITLHRRTPGLDATPIDPGLDPVVPRSFESGLVTFRNLAIDVAPGDTLTLGLETRASLSARDGDVLIAGVVSPDDISFEAPVERLAAWPLAPSTGLRVDGMSSKAIGVETAGAVVFEAGSARNAALSVVVPANGYEPDEIQRFDAQLLGSARYPDDITVMELWADDGDGSFDATGDRLLGPLTHTGARWELTGIAESVPAGGRRLFVTVDVAETATQGATLRLLLPTLPDVALGMLSDNDGPIDVTVQNPFFQTVSVPDRVILTASEIPSGSVPPGTGGVHILRVTATNTYTDARVLSNLTLENATTGQAGSSQAELDAELSEIVLRIDGDDDGELDDIATDPIAGTAVFEDGWARFNGIGWMLPASMTRELFVTADVSPVGAADGDVLGAIVAGAAGIGFTEPTAAAAVWPLDSGSRLTVDGLVAAQVALTEVTPGVLAAGDPPTRALDVRLPQNGYAPDELNGLEIVNLGTAIDSDFDALTLYRDGGDGLFDPLGDDANLGPMVWLGGYWRSAVLAEPVLSTGVRLFVAIDVADAPTDSATVRLAVPIGGVTMASNADGPIDLPVSGINTLLLSSSPLVASLSFDRPASTLGQSVIARLTARNEGIEDVVDVAPGGLTADGDGTLSTISGPLPVTIDLAPGESGTFTWTFDATGVGNVQLSAGATGTGMPSSTPRGALATTSDVHRVLDPAVSTDLFAVENMPFVITIGQTDIVPLTLTFVNSGDEDTAPIQVTDLRFLLEDDAGAGIVPADQLTRVAVVEGATTYLDKTALEMSGNEVLLALGIPVILAPGDPVTLSLRLDLSLTPASSTFRILIPDSTWFEVRDAVSLDPVSVNLVDDVFPLVSGLGQVVSEADLLNVRNVPLSDVTAGAGTAGIDLLALEFENPGSGSSGTAIHVGALTVSLVDTTGLPLANAGAYLRRIRAMAGTQSVLDRGLTASDSTLVLLNLLPPIVVPVDATVRLDIEADLSSSSPAGLLHARLGSPTEMIAWDAASGNDVPVVYETPVNEGGDVLIQLPATGVLVSGSGAFPATVPIGSSNVTVLSTILRHPGMPGAAPARIDSLVFEILDDTRAAVDGNAVIDLLRLELDGTTVAVTGGPFASPGRLEIPLSDVYISPLDQGAFALEIDIEADAPPIGLEILLDDTGIHATDPNLGTALSIIADAAFSFPISSALTRLELPAEALIVAFEDHMPPVIAALDDPVAVLDLTLTNQATNEVSAILVERLTLRAWNRALEVVPAGSAAASMILHSGGKEIATAPVLPIDSVAVLVPVPPIVVNQDRDVDLSVLVAFREGSDVVGFRLGLGASDVGVVHPENELVTVRVEPEPGHTFPYRTRGGTFTELDLATSYSNFPNPFAAGRGSTTFVFALDRPGRVSLRLLGPRGHRVKTLADGQSFATGLHQSLRWDGRNGAGRTVRNGVYVAELRVAFDDGQTERLRRKVAVIR